MLKIGIFSKLSRISIRMLRHYDEIGLLHPAEIDRFTGYRYYREDQLLTAGRIRALRDMGFSLTEISEIIRCYEDKTILNRYFSEREAQLLQEEKETAYRLRLLDTARKWLGKDEDRMNYSVSVKTIPERTVGSLRMTLPTYNDEGMAWKIFCEETDALNLIPDEPCLCCAVFHDSEYRETDVDVEIQKTVKGSYPDTEHVRFYKAPAVTVASAVHNGSYLQLDDVMNTVAAWVNENGYEFSGPAFNIYHVSPHETQNPDEFVTEVCYPVTKMNA